MAHSSEFSQETQGAHPDRIPLFSRSPAWLGRFLVAMGLVFGLETGLTAGLEGEWSWEMVGLPMAEAFACEALGIAIVRSHARLSAQVGDPASSQPEGLSQIVVQPPQSPDIRH